MTVAEFLYAKNFPTLVDDDIDNAAKTVSVMFSGVLSCWKVLDEPIRSDKRRLMLNLLVAWYLLDFDPTKAVGVMGNGGMAISSKSIGGTSLSFGGMGEQEGLAQLNSNVFGQKALLMMQGIPERFGIYV